MLRIADLIEPENVAIDLKATNKKHALFEAAKLLATSSSLPEPEIFKALVDRENLGSTGFGRGVAVPHARIRNLDHTYMVFLRLAHPVDFEASDEQPVDLICAIVGNYGATAEPLEALAGACRGLRNPEILAKLRLAKNTADLYSVLIKAG